MIYRSNLSCPDLAPHFKHLHSRVMGHSFGHDVPSDWADKADDDPVFGIYKRCGFWTHDEAAILYNVAKIIKGWWLDIGCHTGWTSAHIAAGAHVECIDPMLSVRGFVDRWAANLSHCWDGITAGHYMTSNEFFTYVDPDKLYDGFCIDGDHEPGAPLQDAQNAAAHLAPTGVIMFHDGVGGPCARPCSGSWNGNSRRARTSLRISYSAAGAETSRHRITWATWRLSARCWTDDSGISTLERWNDNVFAVRRREVRAGGVR